MTKSESTDRIDDDWEPPFDRAVQLIANDSVSTETVERVKNRAKRLNDANDDFRIVNASFGTQERLNRRRLQRMTALTAVSLLLLVSGLSIASLSSRNVFAQLIARLKGLKSLVSVNWFASQSPNATTETLIGQDQLITPILLVPSIQKELHLTDEQLAKIAEIKVNPFRLTFSEAIAPLESILTEEQLREFKRTAFQGLMVRAFSVPEVRDSLELTPEQVASITEIQAQLKNRLQPFQDKLRRQEDVDPLELYRDTATFYEDAYLEAVELLTIPQRKIWEEIAKPVPLRSKKGDSEK